MNLIKTSLLNGVAVIIKMATLLGVNKVLAIYVGPAGYAAIGQFQNSIQIITTFASGAINTGVTKYTAEYYDHEEKQQALWRTAGTIALVGSIITGLVITAFSNSLASFFLNDNSYYSVFIWFAATLIFFVLNNLLLAVLNGKKEIQLYVIANIAGSLFSLIITGGMVIAYGLYGALVSLAIYQSLVFFVTSTLCYKTTWFKFDYLFGRIDKQAATNLAKYTAMALTTAACVPVSHILVRNHLGDTLGWDVAGHWEAMWRLSAAYLMLVTTTLSVYYLPRLSELEKANEIKQEIIQGYKIILPVAALCGVIIYLMRDIIISILFTKEFMPMRELFAWQMLGDTLKIGSWLLAYLMLGKAMYKLFMISEIIFAASFVLLTHIFVNSYGLIGTALAHAINYGLYWLLMYFGIWKKLA